MPRLTSTQAKQVSARRFAASQQRRANVRIAQEGVDEQFMQDLREDTARATAPVETRTSAKGMLAEYIETVKQIPDGFYALPLKNSDDVNFFEVRTEGNRNWVYRLHGAPGDFRRERMSYQLMGFAAKHILGSGGGRDAAILFGKTTGTCGRCNSPLTNADSRAIGLGPTCKRAYRM